MSSYAQWNVLVGKLAHTALHSHPIHSSNRWHRCIGSRWQCTEQTRCHIECKLRNHFVLITVYIFVTTAHEQPYFLCSRIPYTSRTLHQYSPHSSWFRCTRAERCRDSRSHQAQSDHFDRCRQHGRMCADDNFQRLQRNVKTREAFVVPFLTPCNVPVQKWSHAIIIISG